jgi:hypothetical protein
MLIEMRIMKTENQYTYTTYSLKRKILWWREQSIEEDKGGSFNLELYLDYLDAQDEYLNPIKEDK